MELASARALKQEITQEVVRPAVAAAQSAGRFGVRARAASTLGATRTVAMGVAGEKGDYKLAVRLQRRSLQEDEALLNQIRERAKGEVDIRYIGRVLAADATAQALPWHQVRQRPLLIGSSIGHHAITAGTLGAFVTTRDGQLAILSNNHVLANENNAAAGDNVLQQGPIDGGAAANRMGALLTFEPLRRNTENLIDAAICSVAEGVGVDRRQMRDLGVLNGLRAAPLEVGERVFKVGRTTGMTQGKVTAVELDNVVVGYVQLGDLEFNNQIEIEGAGTKAFSAGGDSGSVIVDDDFNACALLFAGGDQGGSNDKGLTFANPLSAVLETLDLQLAL